MDFNSIFYQISILSCLYESCLVFLIFILHGALSNGIRALFWKLKFIFHTGIDHSACFSPDASLLSTSTNKYLACYKTCIWSSSTISSINLLLSVLLRGKKQCFPTHIVSLKFKQAKLVLKCPFCGIPVSLYRYSSKICQ